MVVTDFPDHKNTMKMTKRSSQITVQVVGQKKIMKSQFGKKNHVKSLVQSRSEWYQNKVNLRGCL